MRRSDFQYDLPAGLIARYPTGQRTASRLLCLDGNDGNLADRQFRDLPDLLQPTDLLVFNDTRVLAARLFARKRSGGHVEILVERLLESPDEALIHLRASKKPRPDAVLDIGDRFTVTIIERQGELWRVRFSRPVTTVMEQAGHMPLPPYIDRADEIVDRERYQTVYARHAGAVAAPTAGLHFDEQLLDAVRSRGVETAFLTLHVGAATFQPVRSDAIDEHVMHAERLKVPASVCAAVTRTQEQGGRVIAVGTTSVRALETAAANGQLQPVDTETRLFIRPGYRFRVVDCLLTNFHLPESTLLMLVSAFAGRTNILEAYRHAVQQRYRFFSYGDAMFMTRRRNAV